MILTNFTIQIIDTFENDRVLAEERTEQAAPQLVYNGGDDKYQALLTSELNFNLSVPGASDGAFFHLFTGNDTRYKVLLRDQDNVPMWSGFLMPDQYSEPYKNAHLFVAMTATDGIGRLKGKTLPYMYYGGEFSVIKLIAECLKLTGLTQVINFAPAILPAANNYRWDEIVVDATVYREEEGVRGAFGILEKLPKRKSAYEILELLVKAIGCTLFTWNDQWYVIGINRKHEVNSNVLKYSADGVLEQENVPLVRPVQPVVFEATPIVTVKSPWKKVSVTWAVDEDGNLLPENIITEDPDRWHISTGNAALDAGSHGLPNEDPLRHWEKVGTISVGVGSREGKSQVDNSLGVVSVPAALGPYNLNISKKYTTGTIFTPDYNETGETHEGTFVNFIRLKKPPYLKKSDEYIKRYIEIAVSQFSIGGNNELLEQNLLQDVFRCELVVGNTSIISNRPNASGSQNFKYEMSFRPGSVEVVEENPLNQNILVYTWAQTAGQLERDSIALPHNGIFNVKFFAPVCPDPNHPYFKETTFTKMSITYTAQSEWFDELIRGIDFTTTYDVDIFHGDSMQDLSKKQFRFRRFIPYVPPVTALVLLGSAIVESAFYTTYSFTLSYQQSQMVLANPLQLRVVYLGVIYSVNDLYLSNAFSGYDVNWNVIETGGVWVLNLVVLPGVAVFNAIANFNEMFVDIGVSPGPTGWLPENNEWRESWKRYGVDENRRYGLCLGRLYHDVYPAPIVNLEGDVFGIYNPLELLLFNWRGLKVFTPLRLNLRLTEGKTTITMIESRHERITDYVTE